jgi:hypothetical protein
MEYFIVSFLTALVIFFMLGLLKNNFNKNPIMRIRYSQSHIFNLIGGLILTQERSIYNPLPPRQSSKYEDSINIRVIFLDSQAYWIRDNTFYMADMVNGVIDKETTRTVDIMGMDEVQLKKASYIVDKLTDGIRNDYGGSGN